MKRKSQKRFLRTAALSMVAVMLMTMSPVSAEPKGAEDSDLVKQMMEKNRESYELFKETGNLNVLNGYNAYNNSGNQASKLYDSGTAAQKQFDLRDVDGNGKSYVTPVKLQNPWGTCWGFSAIAMAESSAISEADKLNMYDTYKSLDLSELHLAWFARTALPEDFSAQGGEGTDMLDGSENQRLNTGGFPYSATSIFSSGIGPVLESDAPYKNGSGAIANKGGKSWDESQGEDEKWYYMGDDTWNVPEGLRFRQYLEMEETKVLPSPNKLEGSDKYEYNPDATAAIKSELAAGRAVSVCFYADTSRPTEDPTKVEFMSFNTDIDGDGIVSDDGDGTWAHYTYKPMGANHAVTIVGWDDDYPASNFGVKYTAKNAPEGKQAGELVNEGSQPKENGAWIVKNSWGSDESEFPNKNNWGNEILDEDGKSTGNDGYFYISYYDQSLQLPETVDFNLETQHGDSYIIDQHDLMPSNAVATTALGDIEASMANVFTAEEGQEIYAISAETATPGTKVAYELYRLNESFEDTQDPRDGKLLEKGTTEAYEYGGYHQIPLKGRYRIPAGQKYSIVITLNTPAGTEIFVDKAFNKSGTEELNKLREQFGLPKAMYYTKGVINTGESFVSQNGVWDDWAYFVEEIKAEEAKAWETEEGPYDYDNFSIKAYADPDGSSVLSAEIDVTDEQEEYFEGEKVEYALTVTNDSAYDAADITASDSLKAIGNKGKIASLKAGETATIGFTYTVTKEDVKRGDITNEIEVTNKEGDVWTTTCTVSTAEKAAASVTEDGEEKEDTHKDVENDSAESDGTESAENDEAEQEYKIVIKSGLGADSITDALRNAGFDTPEKIKQRLYEVLKGIIKWAGEENTEIYDVTLMVKTDGKWVEATKETFPKSGIPVEFAYPEGIDGKAYDATVIHMFAEDMGDGIKAGNTETLKPVETDTGVIVTANGLSPFLVHYEKTAAGPAVDSGDASNMMPWIIVMILSAAAIVTLTTVVFRRRTN